MKMRKTTDWRITGSRRRGHELRHLRRKAKRLDRPTAIASPSCRRAPWPASTRPSSLSFALGLRRRPRLEPEPRPQPVRPLLGLVDLGALGRRPPLLDAQREGLELRHWAALVSARWARRLRAATRAARPRSDRPTASSTAARHGRRVAAMAPRRAAMAFSRDSAAGLEPPRKLDVPRKPSFDAAAVPSFERGGGQSDLGRARLARLRCSWPFARRGRVLEVVAQFQLEVLRPASERSGRGDGVWGATRRPGGSPSSTEEAPQTRTRTARSC